MRNRPMPTGPRLQVESFNSAVAGKGFKPKLWGFYSPRGSKPSTCKVVSYAGGVIVAARIVQSRTK